jgi:hypothetical protein
VVPPAGRSSGGVRTTDGRELPVDGSTATEVERAVSRLARRLPELGGRTPAAPGPVDGRLPPWLQDVGRRGLLAPLEGVEVQFGGIDDPDLAEDHGEDWYSIALGPAAATYDEEVEQRLLTRYAIVGGSSTTLGSLLAVRRDGADRAVHEFEFESVLDEISGGGDPADALGELFTDLVELLDAITAVRSAGA